MQQKSSKIYEDLKIVTMSSSVWFSIVLTYIYIYHSSHIGVCMCIYMCIFWQYIIWYATVWITFVKVTKTKSPLSSWKSYYSARANKSMEILRAYMRHK